MEYLCGSLPLARSQALALEAIMPRGAALVVPLVVFFLLRAQCVVINPSRQFRNPSAQDDSEAATLQTLPPPTAFPYVSGRHYCQEGFEQYCSGDDVVPAMRTFDPSPDRWISPAASAPRAHACSSRAAPARAAPARAAPPDVPPPRTQTRMR
jgi:hypothetical protein